MYVNQINNSDKGKQKAAEDHWKLASSYQHMWTKGKQPLLSVIHIKLWSNIKNGKNQLASALELLKWMCYTV